MPRRMVLFLVSMGMVAAAGLSGYAQEAAKKAEPKADEKIVYTFKDDEELKQFSQMFVAKQNVLTRMAVLQQYLGLEQENLKQVNGQLFLQYKVDPEKNYTLDGEKRVLRERLTPPPAAPSAARPAKP